MREESAEIVRDLRQAGHVAYWVGGCVRDLVLGRVPHDYDIATSAPPEVVSGLFESTREVGRSFGVLHVQRGEHWIEVATFRSEGPYSDARHPDHVQYTDVRRDALRRDFTINALYMDPATEAILDFVGGQDDLRDRRLRAVGNPDERFAEDALRLLRAVRFACRFDLAIEERTYQALCTHAGRIAEVSAERVRDEFLGILVGPNRRRGLELLRETGLLQVFAPELLPLDSTPQSPEHHPEGNVWEHTLRMLALLADPDPALALGALLHDVGKPVTRTEQDGVIHFHGHAERGCKIASGLMERLRIPNAMQEVVLALIGQHMRFIDTPRMKKSTLRRFCLQEHFARLLELHRLDALSSRGDLTTYDLCQGELRALAQEAPPVRPLLTGHDLASLGYTPGPRMGVILRALVDAQLEGEVADPKTARAWLEEHYDPDPQT